MLAIDLSAASLGYAKARTGALGVTNIDYAQADILQLGATGRTFDMIQSAGVLSPLLMFSWPETARRWKSLA